MPRKLLQVQVIQEGGQSLSLGGDGAVSVTQTAPESCKQLLGHAYNCGPKAASDHGLLI